MRSVDVCSMVLRRPSTLCACAMLAARTPQSARRAHRMVDLPDRPTCSRRPGREPRFLPLAFQYPAGVRRHFTRCPPALGDVRANDRGARHDDFQFCAALLAADLPLRGVLVLAAASDVVEAALAGVVLAETGLEAAVLALIPRLAAFLVSSLAVPCVEAPLVGALRGPARRFGFLPVPRAARASSSGNACSSVTVSGVMSEGNVALMPSWLT